MNSLPNSSLIAFVAVIVVVVLLSKISNMLNPKSKEYLIYMRMRMFFLKFELKIHVCTNSKKK